MLIVQKSNGGPWVCINEETEAVIEFVDVTAISRFGTALNSGVEGLFTQLETGTIFTDCTTPEVVQQVWQDFFVADEYISMIGWNAVGEQGIMAEELVAGAEDLAATVLEGEGIEEWVLLVLGLLATRGQKTKSDDVDISRATPPRKFEPSDVGRVLAHRKTPKKVSILRKPKDNASTATHSVQWMNVLPQSGDSVTVKTWGISGGVFQHQTISPDPAGTVVPSNGIQTLGWYDGAWGWEPESDGWIIFGLPNVNVGVNVHEPGRVADIGTPPYYEIWYSGIEGNAWTKPVRDPSQKYVFPMDKVGGYRITVTPQASAETLFVTVTIHAS